MASLTDLRTTPKGYTGKRPWQVRYRDHTGKQRSEQFTRKQDAETRVREVQSAEETGRMDVLDAGTVTLSEIGVRFFQLHKGEWKKNTGQGYAYMWNAAIEGESKYPRAAIADMQIRNIRKSHVTEWRNDSIKGGVPASTVGRVLWLIARALDFAEDEDMIEGNPAARVKPPKSNGNGQPTVIAPDQVEAIRAATPDARDRVFVSVLAYLGLRPHEARLLKANQFGGADLHLERATSFDGKAQPLKKGHEYRDVPICAALADDVAAVKWGKGYMFPNVHGKPWTKTDYDNWRKRRFYLAVEQANRNLTDAAKKANKEPVLIPEGFTPYDLRHSIVSLWYRQRIDKATIASWAGHSVAVLEKTYAHHFKTLDTLDRRTVDEMIADARKATPEGQETAKPKRARKTKSPVAA